MDLSKPAHCPICGNGAFKFELQTRDYAVSQQEFTLASCTNCHLWVTQPRPSIEALPNYYKSATYISHKNTAHSFFDQLYFLARKVMLRAKLRLIEKHHGKGRLLDYGCGAGAYLAHAQAQGWATTGYEPSAEARNAAQPGLKIQSSPTDLHGPFDVITLWHVLEHLPEPASDLDQLHKLLAPGGVLVIAVPNRAAWDAQYYQTHWAAYDVPRHLWHFEPANIQALLQRLGLQLIETRPLWLDSFYVSLLSERYQQKPLFIALLNAFWHGLFSNWKARQTKNYSSLIYLARK
jgi:SAM-dependent methyltransferase